MANESTPTGLSQRLVPRYGRYAVLSLLIVLVISAVVYFTKVLLPFVLAMLLAYLLSPVVGAMHRIRVRGWRVPRGMAIIAIYALFFLGMYLAGRFIAPSMATELNRIVNELPRMMIQIEKEWIAPAELQLNDWLAQFTPPVKGSGIEEGSPESHANSTDPDSTAYREATANDITGLTPINSEDNKVSNFDALGRVVGADGQSEAQLSSSPTPATPNPWQTLVDDYTYVVRPLDGGRFEVVPRRRQTDEAGTESDHRSFNQQITASFQDIRQRIEGNFFELVQAGQRHLGQIVGSFVTTLLVFMIAAFVLVDPARIHDFLRGLLPANSQQKFDDLVHQLDRGLSGVVRGQLTICVVNGIFTGVGLFILDVPFAITLTVVATVFSLIPIFGVLISSIPIAVMALSVSWMTAVLMVLWIALIHFIEGNFLNPKIMGDAARIHPALVIFALLVGQYSGGVIGALIAVPIFSIVQNSFLYLRDLSENWEQTA